HRTGADAAAATAVAAAKTAQTAAEGSARSRQFAGPSNRFLLETHHLIAEEAVLLGLVVALALGVEAAGLLLERLAGGRLAGRLGNGGRRGRLVDQLGLQDGLAAVEGVVAVFGDDHRRAAANVVHEDDAAQVGGAAAEGVVVAADYPDLGLRLQGAGGA